MFAETTVVSTPIFAPKTPPVDSAGGGKTQKNTSRLKIFVYTGVTQHSIMNLWVLRGSTIIYPEFQYLYVICLVE